MHLQNLGVCGPSTKESYRYPSEAPYGLQATMGGGTVYSAPGSLDAATMDFWTQSYKT